MTIQEAIKEYERIGEERCFIYRPCDNNDGIIQQGITFSRDASDVLTRDKYGVYHITGKAWLTKKSIVADDWQIERNSKISLFYKDFWAIRTEIEGETKPCKKN